LITQESNYDSDELEELLAKESLLNVDQNNIYNTIINALDDETDQKLFFVDGPGGYGKTFLFNMILAKVRRDYGITLAVASSGIAALLLDGGRTAHSRFKIPIKLTKDSTLDISYQSELAELIRQTKLFIWDEAPMAHRFAFKMVDKTFGDLTNVNELFGGKIFILGEDFRQILPVIVI
jgi:ATP-dependent DNA helicase PIF1